MEVSSQNMLSLRVSTYSLPKAGYTHRLFEDAFAFNERIGRAAIADGASDAFESGIWARLLVASFVQSPPATEPEVFQTWLEQPTHIWNATLNWSNLPWYIEQKALDVGGLSTLLGFHLDPSAEETASAVAWNALAIGDTCLFHLRGREVLLRFPLENTRAFGSTPHLLSTRLHHTQTLLQDGGLSYYSGTCQVGDTFLLATDEMAAWLYNLTDQAPFNLDWESLSLLFEEEFEALITELRARAVLRNDDMTLLVLQVCEA